VGIDVFREEKIKRVSGEKVWLNDVLLDYGEKWSGGDCQRESFE